MRHAICRTVALALLGLSLGVLPEGLVHADPPKIAAQGYVRLRPAYHDVRVTPNNPESILFPATEREGQAFGLLRTDMMHGGARVHFQIRPDYVVSKYQRTYTTQVDEGYLDVTVTDKLFVFAGRRNLVTGVAHMSNPTDFLGEQERLDLTLPETERRELRNGLYLAGIEHFLANGSLAAVVAPHIGGAQTAADRFQLKAASSLPSWNTDLELIALFTPDRPGVGVNISHTAGDALVLYTEGALRRGRDRPLVEAPTGTQEIVKASSKGWFPNVVVGGQYTFGNALNLTLEYQYNANGYTASEWLAIQRYIEGNAGRLAAPGALPAIGNLAAANQIVGRDVLRRNYLFGRVIQPDWYWNTEPSLLVLKNLDDGSYAVQARLDKNVTSKLAVGLLVQRLEGGRWAEFGLRPASWSVVLDFKYFVK